MTDGSSPDPSWPRRGVRWSLLAALGCVLLSCGDPPPARDLPEFEARLERLRVELRIPGFSAGIVKDQRLVWARGFGLSDVEAGQPAAAGTSYHLASVTKTFASTVLLHLVEEGTSPPGPTPSTAPRFCAKTPRPMRGRRRSRTVVARCPTDSAGSSSASATRSWCGITATGSPTRRSSSRRPSSGSPSSSLRTATV